MHAIKILRGVGVSGKSLEAGKIYKVSDEVSLKDAQLIVAMGKAVAVTEQPNTPESIPAEEPSQKETKKKKLWGK